MNKPDGKPVDLTTTDPFKHDGVHFAVGDVLLGIEPELAKELCGAGRVRLATDEESAAARKAPKKVSA